MELCNKSIMFAAHNNETLPEKYSRGNNGKRTVSRRSDKLFDIILKIDAYEKKQMRKETVSVGDIYRENFNIYI